MMDKEGERNRRRVKARFATGLKGGGAEEPTFNLSRFNIYEASMARCVCSLMVINCGG